jgi:hypothetical protein
MARTPPTPRDARYFGLHTRAHVDAAGTWIEPEELAYPAGGFTRRAYVELRPNPHNPVSLPYGQLRIVRCSIPDTYFTIPARLQTRAGTVRGYISRDTDRDVDTFTPDADPARCTACPPGTGCRQVLCPVCSRALHPDGYCGRAGCTYDDARKEQ